MQQKVLWLRFARSRAAIISSSAWVTYWDLQCYAEHYVANSKGDVWFDGVADMLNGLRETGLQLAVATGKSRKA